MLCLLHAETIQKAPCTILVQSICILLFIELDDERCAWVQLETCLPGVQGRLQAAMVVQYGLGKVHASLETTASRTLLNDESAPAGC